MASGEGLNVCGKTSVIKNEAVDDESPSNGDDKKDSLDGKIESSDDSNSVDGSSTLNRSSGVPEFTTLTRDSSLLFVYSAEHAKAFSVEVTALSK